MGQVSSSEVTVSSERNDTKTYQADQNTLNMGQNPSSMQSGNIPEESTTQFDNKEEETNSSCRSHTFGDVMFLTKKKMSGNHRNINSAKGKFPPPSQSEKVTLSYPSLPQSEKKTTFEKKECIPSLQKQQYSTVAAKSTTSSISKNTIIPHIRKMTLEPIEPIKSLKSSKYESRLNFSQKYLYKTPENLYKDFKKNICDCDMEHIITSFRIYKRPKSLNENPILEIVYHLMWKNYYRVFGEFKCENCKKKWKSAYIYILLQKFITKTPEQKLCKGDFYVQECKSCMKEGFISLYEPLKLSEIEKPHKKELCAKCMEGDECKQSGNYFGKINK
ncbi:hypothetical protein RclHR1_11660005 [Rhizophagus clarus]|uniref:Zygote arrest protein 1-like isoform X2 n=1 Tax=Rhizophagus clarus TaxID=94130 RepID=A0A2Z6Q688_9GLOM|nr:hypothetical protein RclHR1_11660005 [Rhizophagus clarus]GES97746.1 zygote arrest protein 1-like isoform X2 [Rhizophagus clarus]